MRSFLFIFLILFLPSLAMSDELTAKAQRLLNELGYNAGPVDGVMGNKTRNAISEVFQSVGRDWDQELDEDDLTFLRISSTLKDLVTQKRAAASLSDEELCDSLTALDLPSTFYEHEKRGLDCLGIRIPQKDWYLPTREQAFKHLKKYQSSYKVIIPEYDIERSKPSFGALDKTVELYKLVNPYFSSLKFNRGIESNQVNDRMQFCLDWFGNVSYIAENQSKNMDGSVAWEENTLVDGFVICQDTFNQIYLRALLDPAVRLQLEQMLLSWINNDRLKREVGGRGLFLHAYLFNKATIAIEMFHDSFNWSKEQDAKLSEWMDRRAVEMFPSDPSPLSKKCPTDPKINNFKKHEACQNGGIIRAQALLRVGIWNKDQEFVEMAYVAFHRYMSGIRKDGSNISDGRRGCTAADYNIWASQFMSDFLFHWDRISDPIWGKTFHKTVTPNKVVEYSLSLVGNFEAINKHTVKDQWRGCGKDQKNMTQKATTLYGERWYPRISFAPYFAHKGELLEVLLNNDRLAEENYTAQSGANYEISLLDKSPSLQFELNSLQFELKAKIDERLLNEIVANVPESIKRAGITKNIDGEFITTNTSSISVGVPALRDYRPPSESGKSERFTVKFGNIKNADISLKRETIFIYKTPDEVLITIWLEDIFEQDQQLEADWKPIHEKCGKIVEDDEYFLLRIPIKSNWEELNNQFECIAENTKSPKIKQLIGLLIHAAEKFNLEFLGLSQFESKAKINELLLNEIVANVPGSIKRVGISKNIDGEFITTDTSSISMVNPALKDYRPPSESGKSERFEVKFEKIKNADISLKRETISFYKYPDEVIIGIWLEDLFEEDQQLEADWKPIYEKCGKIVEDNEYYLLEIPIKSNWEELNDQFECIAENAKSPKIKQLIGLLVHAATKVNLEELRP